MMRLVNKMKGDIWVGWVLIVIGWVIVHYLTSWRELNKIKADLAVKLVQKIVDLEKRVVEYHCGESRNEFEEIGILTDFSEVSADIPFVGCDSEQVSTAFVEFKKKALLQNFRTKQFERQELVGSLILDVVSAGLDFRNVLKREISGALLVPEIFGGLSQRLCRCRK